MSNDKKLQTDAYGTQLITDCLASLWDAPAADEIAKDRIGFL